MSPEYVRPYVKAQKNDDRDAEAIAEAATRPTMRFVPVKSVAQSDVQALHRARERLVAERTALINHLRALLLERGIIAPQGRRKLEAELMDLRGRGREPAEPAPPASDRRSAARMACARRADRGLRCGVRGHGAGRRGGPASDEDPGDRMHQRDGAGGRGQQCQRVRGAVVTWRRGSD